MRFKAQYLVISFACLFLLSCKSRRGDEKSDINYMQNIEQIAVDTSINSQYSTLQSGDELLITVTAPDMSVAAPFNKNISGSNTQQNMQIGGNYTPIAQNVVGSLYVVDAAGNIDFPYLGTLNTSGKTPEEFKDELRAKLTRYIKGPTVSLRLTNFKVSVMGEVARPSQYLISEGKATILNALSLAGDLTLYAKRDDILVVRNENGEISKGRIDITDANFINSPFYNLKQGDVVYVSANRNREIASKQNPNTGLYISIASVAMGLVGLLVTVFKK